MQFSISQKIISVSMALAFILTSSGFGMIPTQHANAQGVVDFVVGGARVLDGCEGVTGSRYEAIAAELGLDLQGGVQGGISALGDELAGPGRDVGNAILGELSNIGGAFADTAIGDAVSSLGSSIGDSLGSTFSGLAGSALSIALPGVGSIIGGVMGGLLGGGGPDQVEEAGLRKIVQQGQRIAQYNQQKIHEKERCLDSLARDAGQKALRDLTLQSTDWLQTGFEQFDEGGNPGFVEDLEAYQANVSDYEFKQYLEAAQQEGGGSYADTCGFLRAPILNSISNDYFNNSPSSGIEFDLTNTTPGLSGDCALTVDGSMSEDDANAFLRGDFSAGGWDSFGRSITEPGSSPIGAYLQQRSLIENRIRTSQERKNQELAWGQGFLADSSDRGFTPASIVRGITERMFTSDFSRLELIDEMGEVAGELSSTLIGQITGLASEDRSVGSGTGLSNLDGGSAAGGESGAEYLFLVESLRRDIEEQIAIESDFFDILEEIFPLYQDERVDELIAGARSCIEETEFTSVNANQLLGSIVNNLELFEAKVLQNRLRINWRGGEFFWEPVIHEETQKMIGWNGRDYNWKDDGVERYANQGFSTSCEDAERDGGNSSYILTWEPIPLVDETFNGVFENLEPASLVFLNSLVAEGAIFPQHGFTPADSYADRKWGYPSFSRALSREEHIVWQKQTCAADGRAHWQKQSPIVDHNDGDADDFPDTSAGRRMEQNAQCDLIEDLEFCIFPAYRSPQIISGQTYQRNIDGEIETSGCNQASDVGTHYFVRGGDDVWSTRECIKRVSPQGSAAEWKPGFPDTAQKTDFPSYKEVDSQTPLEDQRDMVIELERILASVVEMIETDDTRGFRDLQSRFYLLQDNFNNENSVNQLRNHARKFIENIRQLNTIVSDSEYCTAGTDSLDTFGADFLDETNDEPVGGGEDEEPVSISSFSAERPRANQSLVQLNWSADADSCTASATPTVNGWGGVVGTIGRSSVLYSQSANFTITCRKNGESNSQSSIVPAQEGPDTRDDTAPDIQ